MAVAAVSVVGCHARNTPAIVKPDDSFLARSGQIAVARCTLRSFRTAPRLGIGSPCRAVGPKTASEVAVKVQYPSVERFFYMDVPLL